MSASTRVVSRYVEKQGKVHSSPEALEKYLKNHPKADKSKHTVKGDKGKDKPKDEPKKPAAQRATTDKAFKGKDVAKMSQGEQSKIVDELAKRSVGDLKRSGWAIEMEEMEAKRSGDKGKLNEIWAKKNLFEGALQRKERAAKK